MKTALAVALTATALLAAPPAAADRADQLAVEICTTLSDNPKPSTVGAIGLWLMASGADSETAAKAVVVAVIEYCPQHTGLVKAYGSGAKGKLA